MPVPGRTFRDRASAFRLKLKIREQLSILVAVIAVTAVGVLSLIFWFNNKRLIQHVSAARFSLTASMKAAQISQAFAILQQAAYSVSTRVTVQSALTRYASGNNTVANWARATDELLDIASANVGGYRQVLQIVIFDDHMGGAGARGVPDGTVVDGVTVTTDGNYTGILPNGTRLNVGEGTGSQIGLLNITGDNALNIWLPADLDGGVSGPMNPDGPIHVDTSDLNSEVIREANVTTTNSAPKNQTHDGFPNSLYPISANMGDDLWGNRTWFFSSNYTLLMGGLILGPLIINESVALISYTLPIFTSGSTNQSLLGFTTVVFDASEFLDIIQDTTGLGDTGQTLLVGPATVNNLWEHTSISLNKTPRKPNMTRTVVTHSELVGGYDAPMQTTIPNNTQLAQYQFRYLFPPYRDSQLGGQIRALEDYDAVEKVYQRGLSPGEDPGASDLNTWNSEKKHVGVGYALCNVTDNLADWAVLVEEDESEAFAPITDLRRLLLAAVFGTFAAVVVIVWPLAHLSVRPLVRLQSATEKNTKQFGSVSTLRDSTDGPPPLDGDQRQVDDAEKGWNIRTVLRQMKRNRSSAETSEISENGHTTGGFRIPSKVPIRRHFVHDELTALTEAFNEMTDELVLQYRTLEDRVRERTQELNEQKKFAEEQRQLAEEQKKVAEEQRQLAEEANEAKSLFIANISHELRTPLTGVLNMCEVAMDEAQGQPTIQKSLEVAALSGKALFRLITDLLTFSRNEVGGMGEKVEEIEFGIPELATELRIFEKVAKDKSIDLSIDVTPKEELQDMLFLGDRHKLSQVLINLVSNSMKFTQKNGHVRVLMKLLGEASAEKLWKKRDTRSINSLRRVETDTTISIVPYSNGSANLSESARKTTAGDENPPPPSDTEETPSPQTKAYMLEFTVEDNGPGIPAHLQRQIFEPFVQADQKLSKRHDGVGLGLSICRQIAKLLGGNIKLSSAENAGATFIMEVPLKFSRKKPMEFGRNNKPTLSGAEIPFFAPIASKDASTTTLLSPSLAPTRILVAEDNPTNRMVIVSMLKRQNVTDVTLATDGREAYTKIQEVVEKGEAYSLVLMDIQMPYMDGIQCTKAVRKLGYSAPIVALTAYAEESNQKVCLDAGMDDFLVKPINKQHLRHVLDLFTASTSGPRSGQTSSSITEMSMGLPTPPLSSIISQSKTPLLPGDSALTPDTNDSKKLE